MRRLFITLTLIVASAVAWAQGVPFLRNFSAAEYHAHNRNFDITTDDKGFVYVANFEGLLYYDYAEWRIIHTPHTTRITTLYRDTKGTIWAGGYNYLGYLEANAVGELTLVEAVKNGSFQGVVAHIWEDGQQLLFNLEDGDEFALSNGNLQSRRSEERTTVTDDGIVDIGYSLKARPTQNDGVEILNLKGLSYNITEANGLCSNAVNKLAYNGKGILWGATNSGLFCIAVPAAYTHATATEGLRGEVLSIMNYENTLYVGTTNGLFYYKGKSFYPVAGMACQCWQMVTTSKGLLVATSNGVFRIGNKTAVEQLTSQSAMCIKSVHDGFYTGEIDGLYFNGYDGHKELEDTMVHVMQIYVDAKENFWIRNVYGTIKCKKTTDREFHIVEMDNGASGMIVPTNNGLLTISSSQEKPIPYPQFAYMDGEGVTWLTGSNGHGLYSIKDGQRLENYKQQLDAISEYNVRCMFHEKNRERDNLIMGGDFGLITYKTTYHDPILEGKPQLHIRTVKLGGDSILWGGYGEMPTKLPTLSSKERHLEFTFALDNIILIKKTLYRYRMDGGNWSAWDDETEAKYPNLGYGNHTFEVQSIDAYGNTESAQLALEIQYPIYQRWYMLILYVLLAGVLIYLLIRFRLHRLEMEKMRLESIVQERTAEVVKQKDEIVKQKDEIEEKSKSLETALHDLSDAQNELIRQEKMATVGKLTQGLIDRILNPLNYINNFSKLSEGLVKDIEANVEDEKENMNEDNYDDTMDVLNMLRGNLQKVGEHGANTTRTLKAMEEMLKDRTGGIVETDLNALLKQDEEMLRNYFAEDIQKHGISVRFELPEGQLMINGNPEQLSKTFMSLLGNAIYAVAKKAQRQSYQTEIVVNVTDGGDKVSISFRDNGIGIEQTILDKIFDPFFTTKTTGEAAGVGLYLSREIVQNHGGDISVKSVKDEYTEFTIILPSKAAKS